MNKRRMLLTGLAALIGLEGWGGHAVAGLAPDSGVRDGPACALGDTWEYWHEEGYKLYDAFRDIVGDDVEKFGDEYEKASGVDDGFFDTTGKFMLLRRYEKNAETGNLENYVYVFGFNKWDCKWGEGRLHMDLFKKVFPNWLF